MIIVSLISRKCRIGLPVRRKYGINSKNKVGTIADSYTVLIVFPLYSLSTPVNIKIFYLSALKKFR